MSTATISPPTMATPQDHVVAIDGVSWEMYVALRDHELNRNRKMTYDQGRLYLMTNGLFHEHVSNLLAQMVCTWTDVKQIPRMSGGEVTIRSKLLKMGLEPDKCYFLEHESAMRGAEEYEIEDETTPPPDLVIEVDVTSMTIAKLPIYAAFGAPEIWRWIEGEIVVLRLQGQEYIPVDDSIALPGFPIRFAQDAILRRDKVGETALIAEFRKKCEKLRS